MWIDDLSDSELRRRLEQRGLQPVEVQGFIFRRESQQGKIEIMEILDR